MSHEWSAWPRSWLGLCIIFMVDAVGVSAERPKDEVDNLRRFKRRIEDRLRQVFYGSDSGIYTWPTAMRRKGIDLDCITEPDDRVCERNCHRRRQHFLFWSVLPHDQSAHFQVAFFRIFKLFFQLRLTDSDSESDSGLQPENYS